ncbi:MAG: YegS/Rv2252/BmrU family lipid kinase [Clostridia bacterium]|nr:YegS/Rv2252/BmrU family lipid kinase [Clostridia bacterium]MCI8979809.1 YegS/Rv2252/BmrU family lipid kinase [Clostridia bacterium]MCI9084998.1 YegS/Rv2252/BmrU family lipid kinase [Clostridia bacterium]NDO19632.1 YegS/Rv2252/BmrU family lipid kinase [Lachnospiraceae bacterium MD329]
MGTIMPKKLLFIFNPHSGKAQIKNNLMDIIDIFTRAGYDVTAHPTQAPMDAFEYISKNGSEYDRLVVSGGDGTLNEAVKGLMTFTPDKRMPMGYIPAGTANDFAATLNIPKNMLDAARIAVEGSEFQCDTGRFGDRTFNYVAAFGAFTDVSYDTPQGTKNALGHMAYILEGIKRLSSLPSYDVKIKYDGGEIEEKVFLCIVMNATSIAGIHNKNKLLDVNLNDGLFEMLVFKHPTSIAEIQNVFTGLLKGDASSDAYCIIKSSHFEFECKENIKWTLDGEYGGDPANAVIDVIPSAMTYIVNNDTVISEV